MKNPFTQLCVWEGTVLDGVSPQEFETEMSKLFNARFKFADEVITKGSESRHEEGGRHDLLFYVHTDDICSFAAKRFQFGIRWWEDVVKYNDGAYRYNDEILKKYPVQW